MQGRDLGSHPDRWCDLDGVKPVLSARNSYHSRVPVGMMARRPRASRLGCVWIAFATIQTLASTFRSAILIATWIFISMCISKVHFNVLGKQPLLSSAYLLFLLVLFIRIHKNSVYADGCSSIKRSPNSVPACCWSTKRVRRCSHAKLIVNLLVLQARSISYLAP